MRASRKYRNVEAGSRVSFVIDQQVSLEPYVIRGLEVRGTAEALMTRSHRSHPRNARSSEFTPNASSPGASTAHPSTSPVAAPSSQASCSIMRTASRSRTCRAFALDVTGWIGTTGSSPPVSTQFSVGQRRSNRSRLITLSHAATKSRTNVGWASSQAYTSAIPRNCECEPKTRSTAVAAPGVTGHPVTSLVDVLLGGRRRPFDTHVRDGREEIGGQRSGPIGQNTVGASTVVGVQHAHPTEQHRHLGCRQGQQIRPVEKELFRWLLLARPDSCGIRRLSARAPRTTPRRSAPVWRRCVPV